jgi:hypothetical protein
MSLSDVELALRAAAVDALTTECDFEEENIAGENLSFNREQVTYPWAEFFYLPGEPSAHTLGDNGLDRVDGVLQISIHYEKGTGTALSTTDSDSLREYFKAGAGFSHGGQTVTVKGCGPSQGYKTDADYVVHTSAMWMAFIPR